MVSVFLEAIPVNLAIARAICNDNRANNAYFERYGMIISCLLYTSDAADE